MRDYVPALDGLRAVAVGIVLLAHGGATFLRSGGVGVDIFFVLSGFLITSILAMEFARTGRIARGRFYARRFLRLVPCLVVGAVMFAVFRRIEVGKWPWMEVGVLLTYTSNWAQACFDVNLSSMRHSWSLAIEEQYYLIWPFAVLLLERASSSPGMKACLLFLVAVLVAAYRASMVGVYSAWRIYMGLDTHMDGLLLGSALAYLEIHVRNAGTSTRTPGWHLLSWLAVPLASVGLLLVMNLMTWQDPGMGQYGYFVVALASGVVIFDLAVSPVSVLRPLLSLAPLVYVGRISYGLYLLHLPVYQFVNFLHPDLPQPWAPVLKLGASFAVAVLSYHLVEVWFLRRKKHFDVPGDRDVPAITQNRSVGDVATTG